VLHTSFCYFPVGIAAPSSVSGLRHRWHCNILRILNVQSSPPPALHILINLLICSTLVAPIFFFLSVAKQAGNRAALSPLSPFERTSAPFSRNALGPVCYFHSDCACSATHTHTYTCHWSTNTNADTHTNISFQFFFFPALLLLFSAFLLQLIPLWLGAYFYSSGQ